MAEEITKQSEEVEVESPANDTTNVVHEGYDKGDGTVSICGRVAKVNETIRCKKALIPNAVKDGDIEKTKATLMEGIALQTRLLASITGRPDGKVSMGIRLAGGGDTVAANMAAMRLFKEGKI